MKHYIRKTSLENIFKTYPFTKDYFTSIGLKQLDKKGTLQEGLDALEDDIFEDCGMNKEQIESHFILFMKKMIALQGEEDEKLQSITIIGGRDKSGEKENVQMHMVPGQIICIVGPTGSGKSRLLGDIECLAQKDTPTKRQILLNGEVPTSSKRFAIEHKLVAQLSQNMNFIMDLTVGEFIRMHAESRMVAYVEEMIATIIGCGNELAGESFNADTPVTALSGGQSRALMIADTALLSRSPIVLIDEIENAGVDRKKALDLLVKKEKIVLMSTHDPILALMGDQRIVIKNGGIHQIIETTKKEKENLEYLQWLDHKMMTLRHTLRKGKKIEDSMQAFFEYIPN